MWQWILKFCTLCIKCEFLLFRFLLRTRKLRVMMERMIQPSVRCVAEVTTRIACYCVTAAMQGKKGWNKCSTCMIAGGSAVLASVLSTGTIWSVGCPLLLSSGSSCVQTCIHVLIAQTSPWCDGSFSGHVEAYVWTVLHTSVLQTTETSDHSFKWWRCLCSSMQHLGAWRVKKKKHIGFMSPWEGSWLVPADWALVLCGTSA